MDPIVGREGGEGNMLIGYWERGRRLCYFVSRVFERKKREKEGVEIMTALKNLERRGILVPFQKISINFELRKSGAYFFETPPLQT